MNLQYLTREFKEGGYYESAYPDPFIDRTNDPFIRIDVMDSGEFLCDIIIVKTRYGFWETHCDHLPEDYRGQGIGIELYRRAIEEAKRRNIKIKSSASPTIDAQRVWKSRRLRQHYRIVKRGSRFEVSS